MPNRSRTPIRRAAASPARTSTRMFERLGIADAVQSESRSVLAFTGGVANIAKGDVEIGIFNISEIVPVKGVTLAGPLPAELQNYLVFAGALHVRGASPEPARGISSLADRAGRARRLENGGLEALGGGK